jgi:hypothetical protein
VRYLIWLLRPFELRNLWMSVCWQSCNLGGFWIAYVLVPVYDDAITVPGPHTHVFAIDENLFAFAVLSIVMAAALALLASGSVREVDHAV